MQTCLMLLDTFSYFPDWITEKFVLCKPMLERKNVAVQITRPTVLVLFRRIIVFLEHHCFTCMIRQHQEKSNNRMRKFNDNKSIDCYRCNCPFLWIAFSKSCVIKGGTTHCMDKCLLITFHLFNIICSLEI